MSDLRPISIGLTWHSTNSGNLGVGALTVGNIQLVREVCAKAGLIPRFMIIGVKDAGPAYVGGTDIDEERLDRSFLQKKYWPLLSRLDCVLDIGAGDSWADIYGRKRFMFLWLSKLLPILRGTPLMMSPQTIGPFSKRLYRRAAASLMKRMWMVVARDPLSDAVAREMAPKTPVIEAIDVAFALPFDRPERTSGGPLKIGVNVSALLVAGGYGRSNDYGMQIDYALLMERLIADLDGRDGVEVHLVAHVNAPHMPSDDDGRVADELARKFPKAVRVRDFVSPTDAKSYISGLDMLIAGRMHACIAAFSSGVPVVPVAYSRKFSGLFEDLLGYRHLVPVKGLDTEAALAFILDRVDRRDELAVDIARGNAMAEGRLNLYRDALERFFHEALARRR